MKISTPTWYKPPILNSPQIGEENQFGSSRKLRFGPLRIAKDGLVANNGTVDSVKVDATGFHGYDSTGAEKMSITPTGAIGYGTNALAWQFTDQPGGTIYGGMGYNTGTTPASYSIVGTNADLRCFTLGAHNAVYGSSKDVEIFSNLGGAGGGVYLRGEDTSGGGGLGSGLYFYDFTVAGYVEKTAIVPTSKGFNALYCAESPEVWFFDFCWGRLKRQWPYFWKSEWEIKPDPMFIEVTSAPYIVIPTGIGDTVQVWGKRKGTESLRFQSKTKQEFEANNQFWSTPKRQALKINK